ncbi:coiled-coil domain-containing protein [Salix suchowensis]|nr:coiled-coil domain-containing protein [Salix suchowensis]
MAATDPQRQFLALIHDFASEKSQERVIGLKKRIVELGCQVDVANAEMEELKGYEFQLALNDVSIQTLEISLILSARVSMIQDEISSAGSEVEGLKYLFSVSNSCSPHCMGHWAGVMKDEEELHEISLSPDVELNTRIRKFQAEKGLKSQKRSSIGTTADCKAQKKVDAAVDLRALKDVLAHVASQIIKEEQEYLAEENIQKQVQEEYADLQRKVSLVEVIAKETKVLQDLTKYPYKHH